MNIFSKSVILTLTFAAVVSCSNDDDFTQPATSGKSIVILHENDVHCHLDGYAQMAGLRNAIIASDTADVLVVSSGDIINGGLAGTISKGMQPIQVLNAVKYDAIVPGNHAFDFGMDRLMELKKELKVPVVSTNFTKAGSKDPLDTFQSYIVTSAAGRKVAFLGCTTPSVMESNISVMYNTDGSERYTMHGEDMAEMVQEKVDKLRSEGVDYVILLSHLGEDPVEAESEWTSCRLIHDTYGIDAVLDAHTHHVITDSIINNKQGKPVHLSQTGTEFQYIGKMWIGQDGTSMNTSLIPTATVTYRDQDVENVVNGIKSDNELYCKMDVATSPFDLIVDNGDDKEYIRNHETNLGDIEADAMIAVTGAQIALVNSGGFKRNINKGMITVNDLLNTMLYANNIKKVKVTGKTIKDLIKVTTGNMPNRSNKFPQVSGIRYTIDVTSGRPALSDFMVYDGTNDEWSALRDDAMYELAMSEYYTSSFPELFRDSESISYGELKTDSDCLMIYMQNNLKGVVPDNYAKPQGRINILW